MKQTSYNSLWL